MFDRFTHRRGFLTRASAALASLIAARGLTAGTGVAAAADPADQANPDRWLDGLTANHRCLFDFPGHGEGLPQIHILNYINTYKTAYGVASSDVNTIGTCYGPPRPGASMPLAWNDAMWAKYKVGEILELTDPVTKGPATRNMFYRPQKGDPVLFGGAVAAASIENLQKMGTVFLMCNNAFMAWVGALAGKGHGAAAEIEKEIRANLLPGVVTVPAMVIAIEKAQGKGIAYNKQG